jgi:hypothetical protein
MIFENLFAVYYRSMVAQRNFLRKIGLGFHVTRNEDEDAAAVLAMVQVLFIGLAAGWVNKVLKLYLSVWLILLFLPLFWYLIYLNNKVFSKNREKRRIVLDNFSAYSRVEKGTWIIFSILAFVVPVYLIIILASNN